MECALVNPWALNGAVAIFNAQRVFFLSRSPVSTSAAVAGVSNRVVQPNANA